MWDAAYDIHLSFWNVYYFWRAETGGSSLLEEHGLIISWRERGIKKKADPGDPSAQGYPGHLSGPWPGATPQPHSHQHTCANAKELCSHLEGHGYQKEGRAGSPLSGLVEAVSHLSSCPHPLWGEQGGWHSTVRMKRKSGDLPRNCWNCRGGTESASGRPHLDLWKHNRCLHPGDNFPQGSVSTSSTWHYLKGKTCDKNGEFFNLPLFLSETEMRQFWCWHFKPCLCSVV